MRGASSRRSHHPLRLGRCDQMVVVVVTILGLGHAAPNPGAEARQNPAPTVRNVTSSALAAAAMVAPVVTTSSTNKARPARLRCFRAAHARRLPPPIASARAALFPGSDGEVGCHARVHSGLPQAPSSRPCQQERQVDAPATCGTTSRRYGNNEHVRPHGVSKAPRRTSGRVGEEGVQVAPTRVLPRRDHAVIGAIQGRNRPQRQSRFARHVQPRCGGFGSQWRLPPWSLASLAPAHVAQSAARALHRHHRACNVACGARE